MSNYHYTKAVHLPSIINEGKIRTTIVTGAKKEKPAVWLTTSEEWEPCCSSGKIDPINNSSKTMSLEEMKETMGVCRIKVSEKLPTVTWAKFKYVGGITEFLHNYFTEFSDKKGGKTHLWNCSLRPITQEYFESIEMLVGNEWVAWDGNMPIGDFVNACHRLNINENLREIERYSLEVMLQTQFYIANEQNIVKMWEKNKDKKGYLEVMASVDYNTCNIEFKESKAHKSSFLIAKESPTNNYIYIHILWGATKTHYKAALAYNPKDQKLDLFREQLAA